MPAMLFLCLLLCSAISVWTLSWPWRSDSSSAVRVARSTTGRPHAGPPGHETTCAVRQASGFGLVCRLSSVV